VATAAHLAIKHLLLSGNRSATQSSDAGNACSTLQPQTALATTMFQVEVAVVGRPWQETSCQKNLTKEQSVSTGVWHIRKI
jgi:hypothetical protein